jgi:hypothetical protein
VVYLVLLTELVFRVAILFFRRNLDEHGVAMRRDDPRIRRIKVVSNLRADARNPWWLLLAYKHH